MNNDQNKKTVQEQDKAPKSPMGAATVKSSAWKRLLAKKWVFPATYMAAAAIILTIVWVYQDTDTNKLSDGADGGKTKPAASQKSSDSPNDALAVNTTPETMSWPAGDKEAVQVIMPFYKADGSNEEKQAATIQYQDTFVTNNGISLAKDDKSSFDVLAAMSGTVIRAENVPLVGNIIEIKHDNGMTTLYESLSDMLVSKDMKVKQGEPIAKAGSNELEKALGVHLHFEVRQNGQPVNPETLMAKK